jgi:RNA-binding protein 5/10
MSFSDDRPKQIAVDITKWNQKKIEVSASDAENEISVHASTSVPVHSDEDKHTWERADCDYALMTRKPDKPQAPADHAQAISIGTRSSPPPNPVEGLEYADLSDPKVPKCLLCQRQFKSLDILEKHSSQSELHKVRRPYTIYNCG